MAYDSSIPAGALLCDGSSLSTTAYAHLFSAIGYTWGGSGANFNLPDLRGKFIRGRNHGSGNDPDVSARTAQGTGGATGDLVGSIQSHQLASHFHSIGGGAGGVTPGEAGKATGLNSDPFNSASTGGNETRPLNAYSNYVIAYI